MMVLTDVRGVVSKSPQVRYDQFEVTRSYATCSCKLRRAVCI